MNPLSFIGFFTSGIARWLVLGAVLIVGMIMLRMHWVQVGREEILQENAQAATKIVYQQGAVTTKVVTKYVKVAEATQAAATVIEKEVIKYAEVNPGLCLDIDWRGLHDRAAANALPTGAQ